MTDDEIWWKAWTDGPLLLALMTRAFHFAPVPGKTPIPVAHLTVRAKDGIPLHLTPRPNFTGR